MNFGYHILDYKKQILSDLEKLVEIPSVCSAPLPGKPFGTACADALAFVLDTADRLGFETLNVDNYAGHASYGNTGEPVDILTHLDVVPPGEGWSTPPFSLQIRQGLWYGRGTADNKGAALAVLYGLKALKDHDKQGNHVLRAVFGCGEEIGSNDLDIYYQRCGYPLMGFTPDCDYGICNSEKGILRLSFEAETDRDCCIRSFSAGTAINSVPAKAQATLQCTPEVVAKLQAEADPDHFSFDMQEGLLTITANGCAAHGASPWLGRNSISMLVTLLEKALSSQQMGPLFAFLFFRIGMEYNGCALGIQSPETEADPLTLNLGLLSMDEHAGYASVDIRYPRTCSRDFLIKKITAAAAPYPVKVKELSHSDPLYMPENRPLIHILKNAYSQVTGNPCNVYSTGGATYARHADGRAVAFGPTFPGDPSNHAHSCDEYIDPERFFLHAQICLEAMYQLFIS